MKYLGKKYDEERASDMSRWSEFKETKELEKQRTTGQPEPGQTMGG